MAYVFVKPIFGWIKNLLIQYSLSYNYCGFTRNQSSYFRFPTWNGLPKIAINKIFGQLQARDRARLRLVCKSWNRILCRHDLSTTPELWIIHHLSSNLNHTHILLASISEGMRQYYFQLPEFRQQSGDRVWLCGSSNGWLIVTSGHKFNTNLFLWNPLNDIVKTLPRLSTTLPRFFEAGPTKYSILSYTKRVIVFSQECVVALVLSHPDRDAFQDFLFICTPNDKRWKLVGHPFFRTFSDILFHDGKLYVLAKQRNKDYLGRNYANIISLSKCEIEVCILCLEDDVLGDDSCFYSKDIMINPSFNNSSFNIIRGDKVSEHLVEFSGQLIVIIVYFDLFTYNNDGDGPVRTFRSHQIQRMEVRSVNGREEIVTLGNTRVALTDTSSLTVPPNIADEFDNGIYFITQCGRTTLGDDYAYEYVVHEQGSFDLETNGFLSYKGTYFKFPGEVISGLFTPKFF